MAYEEPLHWGPRYLTLDPDFTPITKFQARFSYPPENWAYTREFQDVESLYLQIELIYFLHWIPIFKFKSPLEEMSNYLECQRAQYNNMGNEMDSG